MAVNKKKGVKAPKQQKQGQQGKSAVAKVGVSSKVVTKKLPKCNYIDKYRSEVVEALMKRFNYDNVMQVPRFVKMSVNRGVGEVTVNPKAMDSTVDELYIITQQRPTIRKAKKSIANFKLREGMAIGCMVTLRGNQMYSFMEKLIETALPRIRDFKGLPPNSFDGRGNYTFGIREQLIFPEIDYDKVDKTRGFNVSIVTTARTDEEAKALLELMGFPFRDIRGEQ
ncbi:MAG TPA: 50S ribosomal protein L5 [Caldisericia bacterium]|nr:50S ribosomal protein L5 [Caldisericia bacterium]HPF49292.1 50S ribosomal protein L5 [Caldisericia bacterium]HPI84028.1 50S ribosomal protein L5 [Caldisericia bacterium]HPQ93286.1 50S ribosomal protein L5 [Caldisericia bacterium]HRV75332.1 50S ribosomal protein L5 [Caldisericia bacterium]